MYNNPISRYRVSIPFRYTCKTYLCYPSHILPTAVATQSAYTCALPYIIKSGLFPQIDFTHIISTYSDRGPSEKRTASIERRVFDAFEIVPPRRGETSLCGG